MGRPRITDQQFAFRAPTVMIETLKHFAARRGRSAGEVARNAIEIHLTESMLDALDHDDEFAAELRAADVDLEAFRAQTEEDLARLRAGAFTRRPAYARAKSQAAK